MLCTCVHVWHCDDTSHVLTCLVVWRGLWVSCETCGGSNLVYHCHFHHNYIIYQNVYGFIYLPMYLYFMIDLCLFIYGSIHLVDILFDLSYLFYLSWICFGSLCHEDSRLGSTSLAFKSWLSYLHLFACVLSIVYIHPSVCPPIYIHLSI